MPAVVRNPRIVVRRRRGTVAADVTVAEEAVGRRMGLISLLLRDRGSLKTAGSGEEGPRRSFDGETDESCYDAGLG